MSDLIDRQQAIDVLEEQLDYLFMLNKKDNPTAKSKWYGVNWARNTIAELPSVKPKWIPDELLELYANTDELDISNYDVKVAVIRQNILDMTTIDIVRCEECMYYRGHENYCEIGHFARENGFCSEGKRRADVK